MTYRVIDSDDYKASGIETLVFPGGEPHAKLPLFKEDVLLFLKCRSMADIMMGACVWDALNRQKDLRPRLFIPYFPGARQDRSPDGLAPLTRNLMEAWFQGPATHVFDIHSDGLNIGKNWMPKDFPVLYIPTKQDVVGIVAPDEGAYDRAKSFRDKLYWSVPIIQCSKKRDPKTGALSDYHCPDLPERGKYIIVDDICDGGGTFNLLTKAFFNAKKGSGSRLELFVSHGLFSKGLDAIDPRIDHITTTDSWCQGDYKTWNVYSNTPEPDPRLTVLTLNNLYDKIMVEE